MSTTEYQVAINRSRIEKRITELGQIGRIGDTGVCRLALSQEYRQGVELVKAWMEEAGMVSRIDHFGNVIGRLEGKNPHAPILMMGSHIDSQPYGGRFDGVVGVLGAIEAVQTMKENGIVPEVPIEVAAFCDEEGCRFNNGFFGSRGILGRLEPGELDRTDKNGITRRQALIEFGGDPAKFAESEYAAENIGAYLELHIEQGPVLESLDRPVGIVTGIAGLLWLTVEMTGTAGHAGSVPMPLRKDALVGAAKVIAALNDIVKPSPDSKAVGTVGNIQVFPDSRNIIPEKVKFTIDLRDIDQGKRDENEKRLREKIEAIAREHGLTYSITEDNNSEPRYCAEWIKSIINEEGERMGLDCPELMSGPAHDALIMSYVTDYAMIFVRCKEGISHNPKEFSSIEDISLGTELLYRTAVRIATEAFTKRGDLR
ncbi:M20 family metallo-hydrolase [Paenibacillus naphthalenovorans]|uniref:M20 family metallo-hydrolase n=1 Tax=Paenibacillus naphthalenovorans TaxID=162209 RepID=UPI0008831D5C|nr:M20 family metallo-hydrolase [Paenibacillus naphthalenovorans]SDJ86637.1 allantoate deiminase/N-carbamoyl-L-amino-acid hydrolase [Paenibacillus naphthalenovorans]